MYQSQLPRHPLAEGMTPFVRRTYTLLLYALLGMIGAGFIGFYALPAAAILPVLIVNLILWVACGFFGWRRPTSVTLPLFSIVNGLVLGLLAHLYPPAIFGSAAVLTAAAFGGLTLYAHTTKKDFSYLTGFLNIAFWVMLVGVLLSFFVKIPLLSLGMAALGVLTFGGWILYDTSQILQRRDPNQTPGSAAFELLIDIIALFRWILRLLDQLR